MTELLKFYVKKIKGKVAHIFICNHTRENNIMSICGRCIADPIYMDPSCVNNSDICKQCKHKEIYTNYFINIYQMPITDGREWKKYKIVDLKKMCE